MGAVLGVGAAGPVAGGLWAGIQSAAMTGILNPIVGGVMLGLAGLGSLIGGGLYTMYKLAQNHTMGAITGMIAKRLYVTLVHNWHHGVEVRAFKSLADANASFQGGGTLRRMLLKLHGPGEAKRDNGWGWKLAWKELDFAGCNSCVDNDMRHHLEHALKQ